MQVFQPFPAKRDMQVSNISSLVKLIFVTRVAIRMSEMARYNSKRTNRNGKHGAYQHTHTHTREPSAIRAKKPVSTAAYGAQENSSKRTAI